MKRLFVLVLSIVMFVTTVPCAFASGVLPMAMPTEPGIEPMFEQIKSAEAWLSISTGGVAYIDCSAVGIPSSTTRVVIEAKLQKSWGLIWVNVETYSVDRASYFAELVESCAVESGNSYRIKMKVTVYSGTSSESETIKSNVVEY